MNEEEILAQIEKEAGESLAETMWGKPANDIITGISNNSTIPSNRAIWELVQNARDVSRIGEKAEITFFRRDNEFVFQHNGQPFDRKSILALILQTSSKVRNDIVKVGQYGTGFLTTHKFGLKFKLCGSLKVSSDQELYYDFGAGEDYIIDRSSRDKKAMSLAIKSQVEKEQKWGQNLKLLKAVPSKYTTFTYQHEHDVERDNVKDAFEKSPDLAPYVLALNPLVGKISFIDELDQTQNTFEMRSRNTVWESEALLQECVSIICNGKQTKNLYLLKSKKEIDLETQESRVTVILPWTTTDETTTPIYYELGKGNPQIYLYLPLLGSENWGWNYIVHAPAFTCDKDTRDSLLLVGNGQNNDDQAEQNRNLLALAGRMIKEFYALKLNEVADRKYLGRVNFMPAPQERLSEYYHSLQQEWVLYFEQQPLVKQDDGYIAVSTIYTLDNELYKACEADSLLLDALYALLNKKLHGLTLPAKDELVHWSRYVDEWYEGAANPHAISLKDVGNYIKATPLEVTDLTWLHKIGLYLKDNPHNDIALKTIVPNENLKLVETDLVRPVVFGATLRNVMKVLVPTEVEKFVHADFADIMSDADEYGQEQAKTSLTAFVTGINTNSTTLKNAIVGGTTWDSKEYKEKFLDEEVYKAILDLYRILLPLDGNGFTTRMYNLLTEYYGYYPTTTERIDKDSFDIRNCYSVLINDSLLRFTLMTEKSTKADWILGMVAELYGFSETQSYLRNYMVYPDQLGVYKYSSQLSKQDGMPERLKELYNTICSKNIQAELVARDYQEYFVETGVVTGQKLADEIEKPFVEAENYSIEKNQNQKLYIEIIEYFNLPTEGRQWSTLFSNFNSHKANMMLSVMNSPQKRESIFQLMKVENLKILSAIAELASRDDIERIIQLGKEARERELREKNDFEFKKALGLYVEHYLLCQLNSILGDNKLQVSVIDEQGGQDLKIMINGKPIYYIEVKSRWESDRSVLMSTLQHQTSYREKEHYALCAVDMSQYDRSLAEKHIYPVVDLIKDNIKVLTTIGTLNERMRDAVEDKCDDIVYIAGGYQVLVSQTVIKNYGIPFDQFVSELKLIVSGLISNIKPHCVE